MGTLVLITTLFGCSQKVAERHMSQPATFFDAGGIVADRSTTIRHVFYLKNSGKHNLRIIDVEKSCGCLEASVDRYSLDPAQEAQITLAAHITPNYSARVVSCLVKTDDPGRATTTYNLAFKTFPRIQFRPLALNLGSFLRTGTPGEGTDRSADAWLDVFRTPGEEVDSPARFHSLDGVHVEVGDGLVADEPARGVIRLSYPIHVRIPRDLLESTTGSQQQLDIELLTRRGERGSLPVVWSWRSAISASPRHLHFGTLGGLTAGPARVLIRSTEGRGFRILSIAGDAAATVTSAAPDSSGLDLPTATRAVHSLSLRLRLNNPGWRAASGTVTVTTDDKTCPRLPIHWSAFVERSQGAKAQVDQRGFLHTLARGAQP
jgi:hypothetical protein